jgi:hypothetical protein
MSVLPLSQASGCSNPQASISGAQEGEDGFRGKMFSVGWCPVDETNAVEAQQAAYGPNPHIAICSLGDRAG